MSHPTNPIQLAQSQEQARLREDINGVTFHPPYLMGPHQCVILDPSTRILFFYEPAAHQQTFCRIQVPGTISYPADNLLECPGLGSRVTLELIRDFRALIWWLVHGRATELVSVTSAPPSALNPSHEP
jgi:hypothetical protein